MQSDDQPIRDLIANEIHKVRPLYASGVESAARMFEYDQPFYAGSIKQMQNYQDKHRVVYCKACVSQGGNYGRLAYRRLCIELTDDLLGNDKKQVRSQCFGCGFDMYMTASPELIKSARHDEFEWNQIRGGIFSALDSGMSLGDIFSVLRKGLQEHEVRNMRSQVWNDAAMQRMYQNAAGAMAAQIDSSVLGQARNKTASEVRMRNEMYNHQLDAMHYAMNPQMVIKGSLSSAPTVKAKKK